MNVLRAIWPAWLTAFVIACAITVGFVLGVITAHGMAMDGIAELSKATRQAIMERGA